MKVRGEKVTVVGLGETALAAVRLLCREGARPYVTELADGERFAPFCAELDALGVSWECGGHSEKAFEGARYVIPSPGVSPQIAPIATARETGATVLGEMEFAWPFCRSKILAVTGTNGKTTTTELLRSMIETCGHTVLLAGNNALPFSAAVMIDPAPEYIVLEVSSYQLETARRFRPHIAAVLNVTPDHLARHDSLWHYANVKARIFRAQQVGDTAVVNGDDVWTREMDLPIGVRRAAFSIEGPCDEGLWLDGDAIREGRAAVAHVADTQLVGRHNLQNVLAALTMMRAGGFGWDKTLAGLRAFRGVEHRIEPVAEIDGVRFYNDSKSTNVDSLRVALESFAEPVVLIAGGRGKGAGYEGLRALVEQHVKRLVTLGEDAPALERDLGDLVATERASDMNDAVRRAVAAAAPGDVVLLSPACASFDRYANFEERGRDFKTCVHALERKGNVA